jgi:broad specificity phosphatase PhoE
LTHSKHPSGQRAWGEPRSLWFVRHAESAGNLAREAAEPSDAPTLDLPPRDAEVPLSALGQEQAAALGRWFADESWRPSVILSSPYVRARSTAEAIVDAMDGALPVVIDERLRERDFGMWNRLTHTGVAERYPEEARALREVGKFYFRPPGGESWCDVILRARSLLATLGHSAPGADVLLVAHEAVIKCFMYVLETLDEEAVMQLDHDHALANASVTSYYWNGECFARALFNQVAPEAASGEIVSHEKDAPSALR